MSVQVFRALINSFVRWLCTSALGLALFHIVFSYAPAVRYRKLSSSFCCCCCCCHFPVVVLIIMDFPFFSSIIGGRCHKYHFSRDKRVFAATKHVFCYVVTQLQNDFCRDKHNFVAISLLLSRQTYVCHDKTRLCRDKNDTCSSSRQWYSSSSVPLIWPHPSSYPMSFFFSLIYTVEWRQRWQVQVSQWRTGNRFCPKGGFSLTANKHMYCSWHARAQVQISGHVHDTLLTYHIYIYIYTHTHTFK